MIAPLKSLLEEESPLIAPAVFDGISARLIHQLKFRAAYIGSFAVSAAKHGLMDIGFVGLEDMADAVRRLAPIVQVPVIVDGEGGFGNPLHVAHTVRVLERAGASATHIEDHSFGKHLGMAQSIPVGQAVDKIKAALDARESSDFLIIARSDAEASEGADAAVDRLLAYQEAGADALFLARGNRTGDTLDRRLSAESRVPIVMTDVPGSSAADLGVQGADIVLYPTMSTLAAEASLRRALTVLADEGSTVPVEEEIGGYKAFDAFMGADEYRSKARALGLIPEV